MIRINLLAERRTGAREGAASTAAPGGPQVASGTLQNVVLASILALTMVGFGSFFYWVKHTVSSMQEEIRKADEELARLSEIRKKMDEFTKQKDLLERKVNLITGLKRNQQVPVHLLDQISRNLPDFLWLDSLRQDSENHLTINGKATTYNAVADFYNRLIQSGWFVNVTQGKVYEVTEGVSFSLTCDFSTNQVKAPEEQGHS
jgi:Tfp pilus assembly protein PilN